ncbi:hypothetical protein C8F04DRAFT_176484 [Mycena alexandri]|uniref:Uncharacterized protein n=1 Tax=Mycena alexandri TaxID=1745969 RepID=A0AAD6WT09_9AGAR|nr:hypothetical protein C8F04DRAFT_176484 [Mycena alexandri]
MGIAPSKPQPGLTSTQNPGTPTPTPPPFTSPNTSSSTTHAPPLTTSPSLPSETSPAAPPQKPGAVSDSVEPVSGAQISALSTKLSVIAQHSSGSIFPTESLGQGTSQHTQSQGQSTGSTSPPIPLSIAPTSTFSTQPTESLQPQQNPAAGNIHRNSLSTGAIIGVSLAIVFVVSTIIVLCVRRRHRRNRYTANVNGNDTNVESCTVPFVSLASVMNSYPTPSEIQPDTSVDGYDTNLDSRTVPFTRLASGINSYSTLPEIQPDASVNGCGTNLEPRTIPFAHLASGMNSYTPPEIQPDASAAELKMAEDGAGTEMQEQQGPGEVESEADREEPSPEENVSQGSSLGDGLNSSGAEREVLVLRAQIRELEGQMGGRWALGLSNDPPPRYAA